jgi:hypothetical protein
MKLRLNFMKLGLNFMKLDLNFMKLRSKIRTRIVNVWICSHNILHLLTK